MSNYYLGPDGNLYTKDELQHWGIPGMKWGVRRFQNRDGSLTSAGKKRRQYVTDLNDRKNSRKDDPAERKKKIDADIKEADDRVKFYGSKRAAKAAIADEANYAKNQNRGKAFLDTVKWGGAAGAVGGVALGAATTAAGVLVGLAVPLAVAGAVSAARATKANHHISKHARDQIAYTNESEYGHDIVVAMKKPK